MAGIGTIAPPGGLGGMTPSTSTPSDGARSSGMYSPEAMKAGEIKLDPENDPDHQKPINDRMQAFVSEKWQDLRTAYTVYHQMCWQNILYYANMLWIKWDTQRRIWGLAEAEDGEWTPQPLVNYFAPASDSVASIFKLPEVEAVPRQEDNMKAHEVAEIANILSDYFRTENGLVNVKDNQESKGHTAAQLFVLCGNVFTIVRKKKDGYISKPLTEQVPMADVNCPACGWSNRIDAQQAMQMMAPAPTPETGVEGANAGGLDVGMGGTGPLAGMEGAGGAPGGGGGKCPQCQAPGLQVEPIVITRPKKDPITQQTMTEQRPKFKIQCDVMNPLYALPRAGSRSFQSARYLLSAERMAVDEIFEEWGYEAQPDNQFLDSMESSWEIALNFYYTGYSSLTSATKESALVIRAFVEPGKVKAIPEGGIGTWCNEKLINYESWEDACPVGHQLTHAGYLKMPTTFFYRTSMFEVAGVQKELNRYEALIALHSMTSASDSVVIDDNTSVTQITGRGDILVHWRSIGPGSQPPHRMQHGSLDDGIYQKHQQLRDQIQNISATVNVWRGQQAGSVTAAAAISQLRGQAEQMFSDPSDNWQKLWVETVRKGVKLLQLTMEPWQIAEIMGEGHDLQIIKFKQADLDKMLNWVPTSHGLPRTRDEKRNDMLALYDRGALDIQDPGVKIRISELFGETGMEQMFNRDATRARAENDMMKLGQKSTFMPDIEDLQVHLFVHGEHIKRLDFDKYPDGSKKTFLEHYMETKMALAQLMMMQQTVQASGAGAGAGQGAASAPGGEGERGGSPGGGAKAGGPGGPSSTEASKSRGKSKQPALKRQSAAGRPGATNRITTPTGPGGP